MVARGIIHNPRIFTEVRHGTYSVPDDSAITSLPDSKVKLEENLSLIKEEPDKPGKSTADSLKMDMSKNLAKIIERRENASGI